MPALACTLSAARCAAVGCRSPVAARGLPPLSVSCRARRVASVRVHAGGAGDKAGERMGVSAAVDERREAWGQGALGLQTLAAVTPLLLVAQVRMHSVHTGTLRDTRSQRNGRAARCAGSCSANVSHTRRRVFLKPTPRTLRTPPPPVARTASWRAAPGRWCTPL